MSVYVINALQVFKFIYKIVDENSWKQVASKLQHSDKGDGYRVPTVYDSIISVHLFHLTKSNCSFAGVYFEKQQLQIENTLNRI